MILSTIGHALAGLVLGALATVGSLGGYAMWGDYRAGRTKRAILYDPKKDGRRR